MMVRYWCRMKQWLTYLSVALVIGSTPGVSGLAAVQDPAGSASFTVFLRGQRVGTEEVTVARTADGWTVTASGRMGPPLDFGFDKFIARYTPDWEPRSLEISGQTRGQALELITTFSPNTATSDVVQSGQQRRLTHTVSPRTIPLPNNFYSAYEALALRLHTTEVGTTIPVYVAPQAELTARVDQITPRRMETPSTHFELRQFDVTFQNPSGPLLVEVWVDARGRLARLAIPVASLAVVRDDLSTVMARLDSYSHPRDDNVFIPANGFSLAATITPPEGPIDKAPVVILLAGSGAQDRDETVFGIPILGQVAGRLSDAGFFVVRYDKRGVGQSGGRIESTSLEAYADDARRVVDWLRRRRDIDRDRIALVGHSEGGAVALIAGSQMRGRVHALGLVAAPGMSGRAVTLAQQRHVLDRMDEPEADKREKIALQMRIMTAVVTGKGWDTVPLELRQQADTLWFRSWLTFDPANVVRRTNQPILILQGSLDTQIPPVHADQLEVLSDARRIRSPLATRKIVVPGVNHLLVSARTGEADEYPTLPVKEVAPAITDALIAWLKDVFPKVE